MIEILKQALEALEYWDIHGGINQPTEDAITSLRQAIAELESQEPVARLHITETGTYPDVEVEVLNGATLQPSMSPINVYTHPPQRTKPIQSLQCFHCQDTIETLNDKVMHLMSQRTWVGLTDERREQLIQKCWREYIAGKEDGTTFGEWMSVATEAELKQKNGYAEEKNNG